MSNAANTVEFECPKCEGSGSLNGFSHIDNGKCFDCNGSGVVSGKAAKKAADSAANIAYYRAIDKAECALDEWLSFGRPAILPSVFKALSDIGDKARAAAVIAERGANRAELVAAYCEMKNS